MSLNNIQLGAQQLVALYGSQLVEKPSAEAPMQVTLPAAPAPAPITKPEPIAVAVPVEETRPVVTMPAEAPSVPEADETSEKPFIRSLGGNARRVLVIVQKEKEAFLPDGELKFLTTVLSACGLSIADIALVNLNAVENKSYGPLTEHFSSRQVLLFDVTPGQLGMPINFPPFQVQTFKEIKYVHAPVLHLIEADVAQKKSLWAALKNLFAL